MIFKQNRNYVTEIWQDLRFLFKLFMSNYEGDMLI